MRIKQGEEWEGTDVGFPSVHDEYVLLALVIKEVVSTSGLEK